MALNWSPSRTSGGRPASTCRSCVTRMLVLPVPNLLHLGVGDRDQPEAGQRIVDRHRDRRLAVGVDDDVRLPDQQGVEQLARRAAAAAAARGDRLPAVVAPADDLALRGAGLHAPGALADHRLEQVPGVVAAQRRAGPRRPRRTRPAAPATGLPPCDTLIFAIAVWRTAYCGLSAVTLTCSSCAARPTCSLATPSLNAGLARSIIAVGACPVLAVAAKAPPPVERLFPAPGEERVPGRLADPAAQREDADVDVRAPARLDLQLDRRIVAAQASSTWVAITPSRSTATSAVASRNGMRTCSRAVSPGS